LLIPPLSAYAACDHPVENRPSMRHMLSIVIPTLIFIALVYVVGRKRGAAGHDKDNPQIMSNTTFVLCLVVGAGFTVALLFGISQL